MELAVHSIEQIESNFRIETAEPVDSPDTEETLADGFAMMSASGLAGNWSASGLANMFSGSGLAFNI